MTPAAIAYLGELWKRVVSTLRRWLRRPPGRPPIPKAWYKTLVWDVAADTGEFTSIIKDGPDLILAISKAKDAQ